MERILIANRGEIVIRVAKTCRKLGYSPCGIYSDADKDSLHIKHCDSVENIGGNLPDESYLNMMKIIDAARKPYPGCMNVQSIFLAASIIFIIFK